MAAAGVMAVAVVIVFPRREWSRPGRFLREVGPFRRKLRDLKSTQRNLKFTQLDLAISPV